MKILLFKVNQLGDNVVFLPVVEQLVQDFGQTAVHLFTGRISRELYGDILPPEQVHDFDTSAFNKAWKRPSELWSLIQQIRRIKPDAILLDEDQGNCAHLLSLLSGCGMRVGFKRSFIKVRGGVNRPVVFCENEPRAVSSWKLLHEFYSAIGYDRVLPKTPPMPTLGFRFAQGKKYDFVIHAGASRDYQKWGVERHAKLANRLAEEHRVAWVGLKGYGPVNLSGRVERLETPTLGDLVSLVCASRIFIGNNSGPMNLAVALGVPGIIVCGPSRYQWDPYWNPGNYLLLRAPGLSCLPCDKPDRPVGRCMNIARPMACMEFWAIDQVYEESLRWLRLKGNVNSGDSGSTGERERKVNTPNERLESAILDPSKHAGGINGYPGDGSAKEKLMRSRTRILGSDLEETDYSSLSRSLLDASSDRGGSLAVDFANTQIVTMRRHDPEFAALSSCMDITVPDGMPLVWAMNRKGAALGDRVYGPTFTRRFLESCPPGKTHYLVGGSEECGRRFRERMTALNPSLSFVGGYHGGCSTEGILDDQEGVLAEIQRLKPDFIWVGLGTPKQYAWINRVKSCLDSGILLAVGFAFDVNAGMKPDAPLWMQRLGLTWAYRMASEPKRLGGRYLKWNSLFLWYLAAEFFAPASRFLNLAVRNLVLRITDLFASEIKDCVTGQRLGRALVVAFGGHARVIGHAGLPPLIPRFLPQRRLTYWNQTIGFTTPPRPDFPRLYGIGREPVSASPRVLNVVLTHLDGEHLARLRERWGGVCSEENLWIAFGGKKSRYESIGTAGKVFVGDGALRRRDNQREKQSYTGIFHAMAPVIERERPDFIYFCEYDHLPLSPDLNALQVAEMTAEGADVMGHWLYRVDGTGHPHFLQHSADPGFLRYWESVSLREDKDVVLTMFGSGSFWTREAFLAIAAREQRIPCYLELYLPTLAHHLGYRVRGWNESHHLISNLPSRSISVERAMLRGCRTIHPIKQFRETST